VKALISAVYVFFSPKSKSRNGETLRLVGSPSVMPFAEQRPQTLIHDGSAQTATPIMPLGILSAARAKASGPFNG
jgi:hypothetical protein